MKASANIRTGRAVFKLFIRGVETRRDDWVYDDSTENLTNKVKFLIGVYEATRVNPKINERQSIKWDDNLEAYLRRGIRKEFSEGSIVSSIVPAFL